MIRKRVFVSEALDLFFNVQSSRPKVSYHRVIRWRMAKRFDQFSFQKSLSTFKNGNVGLQHDGALRPDEIVAAIG
jgi:hypothetical protein